MLHYVERIIDPKSGVKPLRLESEEYARALSALVVACIDIAVTFQGKILLGRRTDEPAEGVWWILGGRMGAFQALGDIAAAIVHRELGLTISDVDRFRDLDLSIRYSWNKRAQHPVNDGCDMIGHYFSLAVTAEEKREIDQLDIMPGFDDRRWVDLNEDTDHYHYGIRRLFARLRKVDR